MVMVVPTLGKPGCPGCNVSSFTGVTFVMGCAREMTAMSLMGLVQPGFRTKLVMPAPGPAMGADDMDGIRFGTFGTKQCAAVRIVRELIREPVQNEPNPATENRLAENKLTTLGN